MEDVARQLEKAKASSASCLDPTGDRNVCEDKLNTIKVMVVPGMIMMMMMMMISVDFWCAYIPV